MRASQTHQNEQPALCLRVEDVARLLGISRSKAYELVADGEIPSIAIGGLRRVPRKALEELVGGKGCDTVEESK